MSFLIAAHYFLDAPLGDAAELCASLSRLLSCVTQEPSLVLVTDVDDAEQGPPSSEVQLWTTLKEVVEKLMVVWVTKESPIQRKIPQKAASLLESAPPTEPSELVWHRMQLVALRIVDKLILLPLILRNAQRYCLETTVGGWLQQFPKRRLWYHANAAAKSTSGTISSRDVLFFTRWSELVANCVELEAESFLTCCSKDIHQKDTAATTSVTGRPSNSAVEAKLQCERALQISAFVSTVAESSSLSATSVSVASLLFTPLFRSQRFSAHILPKLLRVSHMSAKIQRECISQSLSSVLSGLLAAVKNFVGYSCVSSFQCPVLLSELVRGTLHADRFSRGHDTLAMQCCQCLLLQAIHRLRDGIAFSSSGPDGRVAAELEERTAADGSKVSARLGWLDIVRVVCARCLAGDYAFAWVKEEETSGNQPQLGDDGIQFFTPQRLGALELYAAVCVRLHRHVFHSHRHGDCATCDTAALQSALSLCRVAAAIHRMLTDFLVAVVTNIDEVLSAATMKAKGLRLQHMTWIRRRMIQLATLLLSRDASYGDETDNVLHQLNGDHRKLMELHGKQCER